MSQPELNHVVLRPASKNERRYITRHALGFYRALTMTGLYTLDIDTNTDPFDLTNPESYFPAMKWCIAAHPILSSAITDQDTENPVLVRPKEGVDLRRHVRIVYPDDDAADGVDEMDALRRVLVKTHDENFVDVESVPPWRIVVIPLPRREKDKDTKDRVYIILAYSHSVGDGRSGLVFHRTFLEGLRVAQQVHDRSADYIVPEPLPLPKSLEESCVVKITWSYLLLTLFGAYLPAFVARWFDFQTPAVTEGRWTGEVMQYPDDPDDFRTGAAILIVPHERMDAVLDAVDNFIGQVVVDLRGLIPSYSDEMMVNCVSAVSEVSARVQHDMDLNSDPAFWNAVRKTTKRLAESSATLVDQPIGLLKYLNKFRPWFLEKLGQHRVSSYEISNAVLFDPSLASTSTPKPKSPSGPGSGEQAEKREIKWDIERMIMSQPANVTNCPLNSSVVTRKGGDMALTASWQVGVLGAEDEEAFVRDELARIDENLNKIAS
ncbi:uncharacterized protein BDV17DRAFT_288129 [Aspergillus undulatus]|uniref:uncharacterized protein n=1 Tax=Aspergillus undulatus TaxID=1810928 RepID=UPI003CCD1BCC